MPSAKPRYDCGGEWKVRSYTETEWEELTEKLRNKLREFYPDSTAKEDPDFGHPADEWANHLIHAAESAISSKLWLRLRLTNEELRAEQKDLLRKLRKAEQCLSNISFDLDRLLGMDADVEGCRDKIREILPYLVAAGDTIKPSPKAKKEVNAQHDAATEMVDSEGDIPTQNPTADKSAIHPLPKARKFAEAQHEAAKEMVIRVGRILNKSGILVPASGNAYFKHTPPAIQILKILGDELGLALEYLTWRDTIIAAKKLAPDIQ